MRDYGIEEQFGQEKTFEEFVDKLSGFFADAKRVLKKTGSMWINVGDSYSSSGETGSGEGEGRDTGTVYGLENQRRAGKTRLPSKTLCLIPFRFATQMVDKHGFLLRNTVIWKKPNSMPSSSKDKFVVDYEYFFFFVQSQKYYFEQQFEPTATDSKNNALGRTKRAVWEVNTSPSSVKHVAKYPPKLITTPIEACCPEFICTKCGKPREKIFREGDIIRKAPSNTSEKEIGTREKFWDGEYSDCGCSAEFRPGIVLDPFMGSGTTGVTARKLGRSYIGFDISPENIKICSRINDELGLFA